MTNTGRELRRLPFCGYDLSLSAKIIWIYLYQIPCFYKPLHNWWLIGPRLPLLTYYNTSLLFGVVLGSCGILDTVFSCSKTGVSDSGLNLVLKYAMIHKFRTIHILSPGTHEMQSAFYVSCSWKWRRSIWQDVRCVVSGEINSKNSIEMVKLI